MMPPSPDLALHLATLRSLAEARAAVQRGFFVEAIKAQPRKPVALAP